MVLRIVHHSLSLDDPTAVPGGKDRKHDTIVCGAGMENKRTSSRVELLMPEHVIKRELTATALKPARLIDLKAVWGVSMQALYERAYRFGRVTSDGRQRFYRGLKARGWKTNETGADLVPEERPELAASIVEALQDKGLSRDEIAQLTGMCWVRR
ncbi:ImmA/IrrE family metallo-endopeptidase [Nocardia asteroides]